MTFWRSMSRIVTAGLALLMTAVGAHAFSDEAVKDAQRLLDFTAQRFQAGTAGQSDMAVARYNLLYMRLRAGKLAHAAFCKAAKPELQMAADGFAETEAQKGEKQKWQREVAAMMSSPAACDRAAATANALLFGYVDRAYSPDEVRDAEAFAQLVKQRAGQGTASDRDVIRARVDLLVAKYGAKMITRQAYCEQALTELRTIVQEVERQLQTGQANLADVLVARRDLFRVEAMCGAK